MRVHLFTTTDVLGPRGDDLARLVRSLQAQRAGGVELTWHVLLQNCSETRLVQARGELPPFAQVSAISGRLSLSAARNRLLGTLPEASFGVDTVIAFPDDDCWYTDGFLSALLAFFTVTPEADVLVLQFSPDPQAWDGSVRLMPANFPILVRTASSNGIFFRGAVLARDRWFDETIGLGACHNGGEDTDYVTRAYLNARRSFICSAPLVGHPSTKTATLAQYYPGTALAIAKHACRRPEVMVQFLRKLAVGCVLFARGDLNLLAFGPALNEFRQALRTRLSADGPGRLSQP